MSNGVFSFPTPANEKINGYLPGSAERAAIKAELTRQSSNPVEIPVVADEHIKTGKTVEVTSPHNKKLVLAHCHQAGEKEIARCIQSAIDAQRVWQKMPWEERAGVFLRAAEMVSGKYRAAMNAATMLGQSKTVHQAEIDSACEVTDFLRFNVHFLRDIMADQPVSEPGVWNRVEARPLEGFVYAVTPFNFTAIATNLPTTPALMGCSVVWKPAKTSMASSWVFMKILEEAGLPPGVITMVPGASGAISDQVVANPHLAGIHFTGSNGVFNSLWKGVANNIEKYRTYPRLVGETGGKDFIFAHASADVDALVTAMVRGAFEYQGQKCSAVSRAYVPKSLWPTVKARVCEIVESIRMGDVSDFNNYMGAVIDKAAYASIKGYIDGVRASSDAKIIAGGQCDDSVGYFIRPTVVETTNPKSKTMDEEIFGPVLTVYPYDDKAFEETLTLCDETSPYALTGAVFANDRRIIKHVSDRLVHAAGNFYVNDKPTGAVVGNQPFGGARGSGTNDKAGSQLNLTRWASFRTIKENLAPPTEWRYGWMAE